ncbi:MULTISPECIES: adenine deaminase C-terminal domain-containing protein [unclassified Mesorhizobium]|uniref:adenine deaminase C-terminal domain-containing protein n=2 Tax=Mesorhizobium TaxID=68287 RepID=UPI000F75D129|nr:MULTISPECIES: adenine deaminase C-terminal domain-containing protein [unclassified Mesorhizobium]AZO05724.1 adenine deaminase [Mesorhizobium sp. M2A.F.Ca.ET.043.02.1.1]RUW43218.1 adenine deaminase [Mesorhizobium sp. M2A.F.Ca.ET.015.02.1.1]RVC96225.1 adenine deaminase [Mesorhizobium sp. M2A.F.Ca.ET.017.03.2.1]RWB48951.1 MAG: adenine deaminase [Mesorhizobium sp.]RWB64255.1 MAG: adenine deaminase [Mesorhizobium sp.]
MSNLSRFSVQPLSTMTRRLADVAFGRQEPDLVIAGARVLSTYSERILVDREVWISGGRIAAVKPAGTYKGTAARVYQAKGGIVAPGLVDPHIHIESSMVTACAYAEAALLNGTTTIFCDSHEIGNVMDVAGVEAMLEDARQAPLSIFLTVPSTVPATSPQLETAGGDLTAEKIGALFDKWQEAVALGEKMDFVQVAMGDERSHAILAAALQRGRPVSGHVYGREFVAAYAASGVTDTHEAIDREIADDMLEAGIWLFLRGGPPTTPWHSLPQAIKTITELGASHKRVAVCTDDRDADDLLLFGLDWVTREAMKAGMKPEQAWAMGSLHGATRFGMEGEIGGLGGGRRADLVLLDDSYKPVNTWYGGELVVEDHRITPVLDRALSQRYRYPEAAYHTVKLPKAIRLTPDLPIEKVVAHTIRTELPGITLGHERITLEPANDWQTHFDRHGLCFVTVVERHGKSVGNVAHGLLSNFALKRGAVASSVGHDSHNIIVAGVNEVDMQVALRALEEKQGGVCVVHDGKVTAMVDLPIAGLLSDKRVTEVAEEMKVLKREWEAAGCSIPYMGFNLIPLSVIPEIRITDKGLVLVPEMTIVPAFEAA